MPTIQHYPIERERKIPQQSTSHLDLVEHSDKAMSIEQGTDYMTYRLDLDLQTQSAS